MSVKRKSGVDEEETRHRGPDQPLRQGRKGAGNLELARK